LLFVVIALKQRSSYDTIYNLAGRGCRRRRRVVEEKVKWEREEMR